MNLPEVDEGPPGNPRTPRKVEFTGQEQMSTYQERAEASKGVVGTSSHGYNY
jgi:hypothetical protein